MVVSLDDIPESILGVIIGSLLAFGGTSVATFFQLRHDAKQRERDRKMQLRRELFLEAAEGAPGPDYFIKVANPDVPLGQLGVPTAKPAWMNKLFAAASSESIEAFADAAASFAASVFELFRQRLVIEELKSGIDGLNQNIAALQRTHEEVHALALSLANQPATTERTQSLERIQAEWRESANALDAATRKQSDLLDLKLQMHQTIVRDAIAHSLVYQKKLRSALISLRLELDFPVDRARLEAAMDRIDGEMRPRVDELMNAATSDATPPAA